MKLSMSLALSMAMLLGVCASSVSLAAEPGATTATLAAAPSGAAKRIIDGRIWECSGTTCVAAASPSADSQPVVRECARAARELGAFVSYETGARALNEAELARCNTFALGR